VVTPNAGEQDRKRTQPLANGGHTDTARLETFADGVMAIAITLLILDVKSPDVPGAKLAAALAHQWPSYAAYVVSFLVIGIIWVNHHHLFRLIERTNHTFLMMNVIFLMTIAALPWPTALVADHLRDSGKTIAAVVYGVNMEAMAIMFNVVWRYASQNRRLLDSRVNEQAIDRATRNYLVGPIVYGMATLIALANAWASLAIFAALAVYWLLPGTGPRATALDAEDQEETWQSSE
jgi:uncharacterized membrane protein